MEKTKKTCPLIPVGYTVLVKLDEVKLEHAVEGTDKKILLAVDERMEKHSQQFGVLVAHGPLAWRDFVRVNGDPVGRPWAKVGDRIMFSKHAARFLPGEEWKNFAVMRDEDVVAVLRGEL